MRRWILIVFPAIDLRHGRCVRLRQGRVEDETVYDSDPAAVARGWIAQGAEWLHVVNLDGALGDVREISPQPVNLERLEQICMAVPGTSIQFGGGMRSLGDVETALGLGATRVVLGTVAAQRPELVARATRRFGPERIVVAIDAREGVVATHGWRRTSGLTAVGLGVLMRERGVLRAVYTDIGRDGMLTGVNVEATAALARSTGMKVIASGGVASLADIMRLRTRMEEGIEGVIIGQALYTGAVSLSEAIRTAADG